MHDPLVVAFEIRRPWPKREPFADAKPGQRRWSFKLHHDECHADCTHKANPFPWWSPRSWTPFWTIAGRSYYFPSLITVWHREPGGRDSGEVCKHHTKRDGEFKRLEGWRFHVHHWKIQVSPLQLLRRRLLTRCAWCGGRSRKGDYVNISHQWGGDRGPWWRGERGLFHRDCSTVEHAHRKCMCASPALPQGGCGECALCGKLRGFRDEPNDADRMLNTIPEGGRIPADMEPYLEAIWAERRAERERS